MIALTIILIGFIVRYPSYTIQTTGKLYIINKKSEDVTVFDLYSGKELATVAINIESHGAAKVMGQDKIAIANYNTTKDRDISICILNTKTNTVDKTIALTADALGLDGVIALPQPNQIAIMSSVSNTFLSVDMKSNTIENKIPTLQKKSHHIALHSGQPIAYITNIESGTISVIDYATSQIIETIYCGKGTQSIDITADGSEIWVTNTNENTVSIINARKNKLVKKLRTGKEPMGLKFSVDGRYCLVTNLKDGSISVFNRLSKKEIKRIPIHGKNTVLERTLYHTPRPVNIIMHPNGLYAFIANSNANKIEIIDMKTFTIVSTIGTGNVPDAMVFVP